MVYLVAIVLAFIGQAIMPSRVARGQASIAATVLMIGVIGGLGVWAYFGVQFIDAMDSLALKYSGGIRQEYVLPLIQDELGVVALLAGAYHLFAFKSCWNALGRMTGIFKYVLRYFSITLLSSAAAMFWYVVLMPSVLMITLYFIIKHARQTSVHRTVASLQE